MSQTPEHVGTESVGDRIRTRRRELRLTQRAIASDGVSYAYISRVEANTRRPSAKALRKLAPRLGVSVHWLETGEDDPAVELAQLILDEQRLHEMLPPRATELADAILRQRE